MSQTIIMDTSCKKAKHNHQQEQLESSILDIIADTFLNSRNDYKFIILMIKQNKDYYKYINKIAKDTWEFIFNQSQDEFKFNLKLINEIWNSLRINYPKEANTIRDFIHKQASETLNFKIKDLNDTLDFIVKQIDIIQEFYINQLKTLGFFDIKELQEIKEFIVKTSIQNFKMKEQVDYSLFEHKKFIPDFYYKQAKALLIFYREQADTFRLFNQKQTENTLDFQRKQADTIREYSCTVSKGDSILSDIILFFEQYQSKTIIFQRQQSEIRQIFHNKQTYVTHDLEIQQAITIQNYFNNAKAKFKVHLNCMLNHVKNKISESQLLKDKNNRQKHFDLIIEETIIFQTDNVQYCDIDIINIINNIVQQTIILLYLTKELDFELDLDCCVKYGFNNSCIKYFKIVSPMLNKLTKLKVNHYEQDFKFSLEFVELLLSFPNLQILEIHFTITNEEFELPKQKLQIKDLCITVSYDFDTISSYSIININTLLKMCPQLTRINLSCFNISTDNINLVKLGEILNQCNNLTDLILNNFNGECKDKEKLNFINIAELLSNSTTLTYLDLSHNNIIEDEKKKIREILSHNQTLKELLL